MSEIKDIGFKRLFSDNRIFVVGSKSVPPKSKNKPLNLGLIGDKFAMYKQADTYFVIGLSPSRKERYMIFSDDGKIKFNA